MARSEAFGPASLAVGTTTSAFMGFLPSFTDIRRSDPADAGMAKDMKLGMIAAVAVSLGTGVMFSSISGSPVPAFVSAAMVVILLACYSAARKAE